MNRPYAKASPEARTRSLRDPTAKSGRVSRADEIKRLAAERGIRIAKRGQAFLLAGPGVSILCADLALIRPADLLPAGDDGSTGC